MYTCVHTHTRKSISCINRFRHAMTNFHASFWQLVIVNYRCLQIETYANRNQKFTAKEALLPACADACALGTGMCHMARALLAPIVTFITYAFLTPFVCWSIFSGSRDAHVLTTSLLKGLSKTTVAPPLRKCLLLGGVCMHSLRARKPHVHGGIWLAMEVYVRMHTVGYNLQINTP